MSRDRHYVMFRGEWRHVPLVVQRAWQRIVPRLFGGCATCTIYANGIWVSGIIAEALREHE